MSNVHLRICLGALADAACAQGAPNMARVALDALTEIERLNKAVGEQTRMVKRWKNRTKHQREFRALERAQHDQRIREHKDAVIELEAQLASIELRESELRYKV